MPDHIGEFEQLVLLALVQLGTDAYGLSVQREIAARTGREATFGTVYTTLARLEEKGLVESRLGEPTAERGGRAKTYFRITAKGLREVRQARRTLMNLWGGVRQLEGGVA